MNTKQRRQQALEKLNDISYFLMICKDKEFMSTKTHDQFMIKLEEYNTILMNKKDTEDVDCVYYILNKWVLKFEKALYNCKI